MMTEQTGRQGVRNKAIETKSTMKMEKNSCGSEYV